MSYPTSSCPYEGCPNPQPYFKEIESNRAKSCSLGVPNCEPSPGFYCMSTQLYKQDIQPKQPKRNVVNLNTLGVKYSQEYTPVSCANGCLGGFEGTNQKLIDAPRAQKLLLDRPHLTGEVPIGNEIYTPKLSRYGKGYTSYNDINAGQIQYYIDAELADPYFAPNFVEPAIVNHTVFMDPMENSRPQYNRETFKKYDWNPCNKDDCDSFTHDQLEFRQELMEKQMRPWNEQRWSNRWAKSVLQ